MSENSEDDLRWSKRPHEKMQQCHILRLEATLPDGSPFELEQNVGDGSREHDAAFEDTMKSRMRMHYLHAGAQVRKHLAAAVAAAAATPPSPPRQPDLTPESRYIPPDPQEEAFQEAWRLAEIENVVREMMPKAPAPEPVPVGNTLPDPETEAKLEAALAEMEALKRELDGFRKLPEANTPLLPDWVRDLMADGETLAQARSRLTQVLNVEKAELRRERQVGEDSAELRKREADIDRQLGELAALGEAGGP